MEHGYARYRTHGCRCGTCRSGSAAYARTYRRRIAYGRPPTLVDAEPVRQHVAELRAAGMGYKRIAAAAGVSYTALRCLTHGNRSRGMSPSRRVQRRVAERLLATRTDLAAGVCIDGTGTRRRLQALTAIGYTQRALAKRMPTSPGQVRDLLHAEQVQGTTARRVRALYDQMWDQPPPETTPDEMRAASRARNHARRRGWLPPMAWDDDAIDLPGAPAPQPPAEVVDEVLIQRVLTHGRPAGTRLNNAEQRAIAARIVAAGGGPGQVRTVLRTGESTADRLVTETAGEHAA